MADEALTLDVLTEEADECCWIAWAKLAADGKIASADRFTCPTCGCEYRPRQEGPLRAWDYFGAASLIKAAKRA